MIKKLQKTVIDNLKVDFFSMIAILMNCTFLLVYAIQYQLADKNLILLTSIPIYILCALCLIIEFLYLESNETGLNKKYLKILWFIFLIYGLGFFPTYAVFITSGKKYTVLNLSTSLLLLAMMVDWLVFMIVSISGILFAYILFLFTKTHHDMMLFHNTKPYLLSYILLYMFLAASLFMRQKEKVQEKKMDFMKVFGSAIAHEVNAPLASMRMLSDTLSVIISNMKVKNKDDNYTITLKQMEYEMLTTVINDGFKKASTDALQIVEMLLTTLRNKYIDNKTPCKISLIAEDAIKMSDHLNHNNANIQLIIYQDFEIICTRNLLKHVIYNLIKNSFKHGGINVHVMIEIHHNKVIVSDNGIGIHQDKIKRIFDAFFTDGNGSGIGLAFCKFVLNDMNAKISCESEVNKFTKFIIEF